MERWEQECKQLRENHTKTSAQMRDFVALFEKVLPEVRDAKDDPDLALACLALHHLALNFHVVGGPKAIKLLHRAKLENLPKSYGNFGVNKIAD